jgi:hypothetical protein
MAMAFHCPSCNKPLYNRRRATCESCGAALPKHLLLDAGQRQRFEELRRQEDKAHREFMERDFPGGAGYDLPTSL